MNTYLQTSALIQLRKSPPKFVRRAHNLPEQLLHLPPTCSLVGHGTRPRPLRAFSGGRQRTRAGGSTWRCPVPSGSMTSWPALEGHCRQWGRSSCLAAQHLHWVAHSELIFLNIWQQLLVLQYCDNPTKIATKIS